MIENVFILLVMLQLKHFVCDYPLQNSYMLGKAGLTNWFNPLLSHASVHATGTFIVFVMFDIELAFIFMFSDLVLHFIVDRIKASPNLLNRWKMDNPMFWSMLGLDQMAHHLINIAFVYIYWQSRI